MLLKKVEEEKIFQSSWWVQWVKKMFNVFLIIRYLLRIGLFRNVKNCTQETKMSHAIDFSIFQVRVNVGVGLLT